MFNKEKFHNALALSLGYERIVNDKRFNLSIEDTVNPEDPLVKIDVLDRKLNISFKASADSEEVLANMKPEQKDAIKTLDLEVEINNVLDAVHQAYIKATVNRF